MIDDLFDRAYRENREVMNARFERSLSQLSRTVGDGLKALHRIEWSAPWNQRPKGQQCH